MPFELQLENTPVYTHFPSDTCMYLVAIVLFNLDHVTWGSQVLGL